VVKPERISRQIAFALVAAGLSIFWPGNVSACKVSEGAVAQEIVSEADLIVHIKVPNEEIVSDSGRGYPEIKMTVLKVLKGNYSKKMIWVRGFTDQYEGPNDREVPYNLVRRGGRHGNCYAFDYKKNGQFLLIMKKGRVHWSPLAPTNEQVSGPNDPWVVWVKQVLKENESKLD